MSDAITSPPLSPTEARQIDLTCDRFEAAWKAGHRPDPAEFLGAAGPLRAALLHQLLLLDWEYRRRAADDPCAADYHTRFPGDTAVVTDVSREMAAPAEKSIARSRDFGPPDHPAERRGQPATGPERYELVEEVGSGGIGVVYRSRDGLLGRELAVKVLRDSYRDNPDVRHRFIEEARVGSQLQHPAIVPVYELGWFPDHRPYFTMRLVEGQTLAALLRRRPDPTRDLPRWLGVFGQVCQAVAYAHTRGVVHRDLKPANVMVGSFGEVQVMDWGFAKILAAGEQGTESSSEPERIDPVDGHTAASQSGDLMGTPAYMPPEQARGETASIDARTDVFALGAILCEILTGQPPYVANTPHEICRRAAVGDLGDARARLDACGADGTLRHLAKWCLAVEPDERPVGAGAVAREVAAYLTSTEERFRLAELERAAAEARAQEAAAKSRAERRTRRLALALAAATTVVMALGVGGWWWRDRVRQAEAARVAVADGKVEAALVEAEGHVARTQWPQARAAAIRARELLQTGASDHRTARADGLLADTELVAELDELRALRATYDTAGNRFRENTPATRYAEAFARYGIRAGADPAETGAHVASRPAAVGEAIAAGLEDWWLSARGHDAAVHDWLGAVLRCSDGDEWRARVRAAVANRDRRLLEELAANVNVAAQPKVSVTSLSRALLDLGAHDAAIALLRPAQQRYPDDFWINLDLGDAFIMRRPPNHAEALRFYSIARALRPNLSLHSNLGSLLIERGDWDGVIFVSREALNRNPSWAEAHNNLGVGLEHKNEWEQAEAAYRKALELNPKLAKAQFNLGKLFERRGQFDRAASEFAKAVQLAPGDAPSHFGLGNALYNRNESDAALTALEKALELAPKSALAHAGRGEIMLAKGRLDDAVAAFETALRLDPRMDMTQSNLGKVWYLKARVERSRGNADRARIYLDRALAACSRAVELNPASATNQYNLGTVRVAADDFGGAIAAFREAIRLNPNLAEAYCNLRQVLQEEGQFAEALTAIEQGHRLGSGQSNWRYPSAKWLKETRRLVELDAKLPGILNGTEKPATVAEQLEYAKLCKAKSLYAASARLYAGAFTTQPALANAVETGYRFQAACVATLAGCGRGRDAVSDDAERARWRKQALDWLRADLTTWTDRLGNSPNNAPAVRGTLEQWRREQALAGIREPEELAKLPELERAGYVRFWADVQECLVRCLAAQTDK